MWNCFQEKRTDRDIISCTPAGDDFDYMAALTEQSRANIVRCSEHMTDHNDSLDCSEQLISSSLDRITNKKYKQRLIDELNYNRATVRYLATGVRQCTTLT